MYVHIRTQTVDWSPWHPPHQPAHNLLLVYASRWRIPLFPSIFHLPFLLLFLSPIPFCCRALNHATFFTVASLPLVHRSRCSMEHRSRCSSILYTYPSVTSSAEPAATAVFTPAPLVPVLAQGQGLAVFDIVAWLRCAVVVLSTPTHPPWCAFRVAPWSCKMQTKMGRKAYQWVACMYSLDGDNRFDGDRQCWDRGA